MKVWYGKLLMHVAAIASLNGFISASANAAPTAQVKLGKIKAQLFYEETGRLSQDILQAKDFVLWNTCIGAGSAEEYANDLLVSIELTSTGEQYNGTPLRFIAKGENGKVIAERTFSGILVPSSGRVWKGVWLRDVACGGVVNMTLTFGKQTKSAKLDFAAGE